MSQNVNLIRSEPFRIFFPIGIVLGFVGVSHWGWYYSGITDTYSCNYHGLLQIQGFEMAFVAGFTMTAFPRFLDSSPARWWEVGTALVLLLGSACSLYFEERELAEWTFAPLALLLILFCLTRYRTREDDPPAPFLLVPIGLGFAFVGSLLILYPPQGFVKLGQRLVEQAALICFLLAYGSYLGPRLVHGKSPGEAESSPKSGYRAPILASVVLLLSFLLETGVHEALGRLIRACGLTVYAVRILPILSFPAERRFTAWLLWSGFWLLLAGQWLAGIFPDYEIVALHLTFVGGFSTITLVIGTRVIAAHCGPEEKIWVRARALKAIGLFLLAALVSRVVSDFMTWYYFGMLHVAAGFWMTAALIWGFAYIPRLTHREDD